MGKIICRYQLISLKRVDIIPDFVYNILIDLYRGVAYETKPY